MMDREFRVVVIVLFFLCGYYDLYGMGECGGDGVIDIVVVGDDCDWFCVCCYGSSVWISSGLFFVRLCCSVFVKVVGVLICIVGML